MTAETTRPPTPAAIAAVLAAVLALGGCTDEADSRAETAGMPLLREHAEASDWVLDVEASTPALEDAEGPITLTVEEGRVSGQGPCNRYHGTVHIDGDDVSITDLASTMRACEPAATDADAVWFAALEDVEEGEIVDDELGDEGRLVLSGPDIRLEFDHETEDDE